MKKPKSPNCPKKPSPPTEPLSIIEKQYTVDLNLYSYLADNGNQTISLDKLIENFPDDIDYKDISIYMESDSCYYDEKPTYSVKGSYTKLEPNPHLNLQMKNYEKNMLKYEIELLKYEQLKAIYDLNQANYLIELEKWKQLTAEARLEHLTKELEQLKKKLHK